jgi:multidrug resistance efflux pump
MARRSRSWRLALTGVLGLGLLIVLALWAFFLADYPLTRDVYFTVALLHVLAEVPFLLRAL